MSDRDVDELLEVNDPLLRPLIVCDSDEKRRAEIETVLTGHVAPLIRRIVQRQRNTDRLLLSQDAEDIASNVTLRLLHRLQRVPFEPEAAIERVSDFVATATFNAIHDFHREHFPQWMRLKSRVRYVLANDARFRTWTSASGPACALASSKEKNPGSLPRGLEHYERSQAAEAIEWLLRAAEAPLLVADVVAALADAWNITDRRASDERRDVADGAQPHDAALQSRDRLAALWRETRALPAPQRTALLLNLRDSDGSSAIALFALMGIATLDEVAAAIDVPLRDLAKLWSRLPLDDLTIASLLGVSRQKVINYRAAARQRLTRRLRKW